MTNLQFMGFFVIGMIIAVLIGVVFLATAYYIYIKKGKEEL